MSNQFQMLAFDGLHGETDAAGTLAEGSVFTINPGSSLLRTDDATYVTIETTEVRLSGSVEVTSGGDFVILNGPFIVSLKSAARFRRVPNEGAWIQPPGKDVPTIENFPAGTMFRATEGQHIIATRVNAASGSTGATAPSGLPVWAWVAIGVGVVGVGGAAYWWWRKRRG